jgi:hypothetical protein
MPRKNGPQHVAEIRFPKPVWKAVQHRAIEADVSASEWIRRAVRHKLENGVDSPEPEKKE